MEFSELKVQKNKDCVVCGSNPSIIELIDYKQFCGIDSIIQKTEYAEMDVIELNQQLKNEFSPIIIDVLEDFELEIFKLEKAIHIPMNDLPKRLNELYAEKDYVIMCRTGARSAQICEFLSIQNFVTIR